MEWPVCYGSTHHGKGYNSQTHFIIIQRELSGHFVIDVWLFSFLCEMHSYFGGFLHILTKIKIHTSINITFSTILQIEDVFIVEALGSFFYNSAFLSHKSMGLYFKYWNQTAALKCEDNIGASENFHGFFFLIEWIFFTLLFSSPYL